MPKSEKPSQELRLLRREIECQDRYERFHRFDPASGCACWPCIARLQLWIIRTKRKSKSHPRN